MAEIEQKTIKISQRTEFEIKYTSKPVEWFVSKTIPNTFRFENKEIVGYQRKINFKHIDRIVDYIKESWETGLFYFPSCIVCSVPKKNKGLPKDKDCFVVDGQHRIAAFKSIYENDPNFYSKIKDFTLPVTILENVDELTEIQTFITINKTSRKVDTSLAMILKNKLADLYKNKNTDKIDFLAVELAQIVNDDENSIWHNQIAFEGSARENNCLLSLNAFVKAQRRVIRKLSKLGIIDLDALDNDNTENFVNLIREFFNTTWACIKERWPKAFRSENIYNTIIAGPIGFSSLNMYIAYQLGDSPIDKNTALEKICSSVASIKLPANVWIRGGEFSKFSSESGYAEIATQLVENSSL
ncbi:DGQHR domain-containing protein [Fibrobacter sp. UWB12]|uniref:DGQHR domain-containing protein n=1 Tax=Fibrobacter sp. UWB12 TaxID=1896203 RepID=UPI000922304B|nr:DGQHR domain-containing protein [Fibrobacter sp. UWB12]SHK20529.1 DGQHR domain-containing protein [Fibrobacter sp. UWB12]